MTDREWQDRYEITSVKGKIWKRSEVQARAMKMTTTLLADTPRNAVLEAVKLVLDDETFMRQRRGMVPARVIEDVAFEAFARLTRKPRA